MQENKGMDFKHKEVINITDARRLGYVQDVCADLETGRITAIIVPGGSNKIANFFSSVNDIVMSKAFDNGMICASEQAVLVEKEIYQEFENLMREAGCYFGSGQRGR